MFSDAISSISWRWRPSSPLIAAAISGSAWSSVAVKNESGAEAVLALEGEGLMGEYLHRRNLLGEARSVTGGGRKRRSRDTISDRDGQAVAVRAGHLCKIWWGMGWSPACRRVGGVVLPSPLRGGVGGGGLQAQCLWPPPPSPTLPRKGGGSRKARSHPPPPTSQTGTHRPSRRYAGMAAGRACATATRS